MEAVRGTSRRACIVVLKVAFAGFCEFPVGFGVVVIFNFFGFNDIVLMSFTRGAGFAEEFPVV